jgi:hypothetical protein
VLLEGDEKQDKLFRRDVGRLRDEEFRAICRRPISLCYMHNIITIRHEGDVPEPDVDDYHAPDDMVYSVTSQCMFRSFFHHVFLNPMVDLREFYSFLNYAPQLGVTKGVLFESLAHRIIASNEVFRVFPLTARNGLFVKDEISRPSTTAQFFKNPYGSKPSIYTSNYPVARTDTPCVYNIPTEFDNPAFDSFIISPKTVFKDCSDDGLHGIAFQMTVGRRHELDDKGLKILMARFHPVHTSGQRHKIIFVVPKGGEVPRLPVPKVFWMNRFDFYLLELESGEGKCGISSRIYYH